MGGMDKFWEITRERFNFVGFVLVALIIVAWPSVDGVWEGDAGGFWRSLAAVYVLVSSAMLLIHVKTSFVKTLGWACLGAGAFFFVFVSSVWFFWLPVAIGSWVQSIRCARGRDLGGF